jgi:hypothetical protein
MAINTKRLKEAKHSRISKKQFYRLRKRLREGKALHLSGKTLRKGVC